MKKTEFGHSAPSVGQFLYQTKVLFLLLLETSNDLKNSSWWRGENCETLLQGICEFQVEEYLDTPSDVYGMGVSPNSINITWSTDGAYWQPSQYEIKYCHKESLSKAALPIFGEKCGGEFSDGTNFDERNGRRIGI